MAKIHSTKKGNMTNLEDMKARYVKKQSERRKAALRGLEEIETLSHAVTTCVQDCNGESGNGWQPDLKEAARLVRLMFWKAARVRALLEGRDTDGCDIEIESALCDAL